jgi:hypothetical protein
MSKVRIVYNKLLGGWLVVRGPHQAPLSGVFPTKAAAQASLTAAQAARDNAVSYRRVS